MDINFKLILLILLNKIFKNSIKLSLTITLVPSASTTIFLSGTELRKLRYSCDRESSLVHDIFFIVVDYT